MCQRPWLHQCVCSNPPQPGRCKLPDARRLSEKVMYMVFTSVLGGALVGASATVLLACNGCIEGISGIVNGLQTGSSGDRSCRIVFLLGLVGAAGIMFRFMPSSLPQRVSFPVSASIIAGLLVGFGTRMGNGCTSGHG